MIRYSMNARPLVAAFVFAGFIGVSGSATAGGFSLIEHGASGLGNSYAGAAAVSSDTSTVWFNPAGMAELDGRETAFALHILSTTSDFTDQGTTLGAALGRGPLEGETTIDPGGVTAIPNFYYVAPINEQWSYGLSIGVPFGSSTEYDADWIGRYESIESGITVIDVNPAVSFRISDKFKVGFGISVQQLTTDLTSAVDSGATCLGVAATGQTSIASADCVNVGLTPGVLANDGLAEIEGDSTAIGFNIGALYTPTPDLKIGVAFRSEVSHDLDGDADFTVNPQLQALLDGNTNEASIPLTSGLFNDVGASAAVDLPATLSLSGAWKVNGAIELLGDVTWTGWSSFEELRVVFDNPVQPDTFAVQDWQDVFRVSAGLNYTISSKLKLRTGVAFDEEAIPSIERRTARIPGNDRTWISFGGTFQVNDNLSFDVGYAHLFLDDTAIDNINPESGGTAIELRGLYEPSVDIFSAQINWAFN